ncbi:unnamed protein product [Symbiodinium microadriaticum]|nr:unnamed protein product [Symbiodinium microadriaticum]
MTGTAAYRHNFATKAEACFSFEPREDSELVPRSPHLVGRAPSEVFTDFTVFASQYAYYVRACDRCRLVNSAWVETTAGVYDEDSAPVVTDDPWIENVTAVGTRFLPQWASVAMEPQITLSAREGPLKTDSHYHETTVRHGGEYPVTIRVEKLRFYRYGIFSDLDGSLSGYAGGSVTGDKMYNRHSACRSVGTQDLSLRLLCDASIFIRKDLSVWTIFGHGNVPYREGWHMAVISAKFQDQLVWPARRWAETGPTPIEWRMLPFWYTIGLSRRQPPALDCCGRRNVDFQKMRVSFGSPGLMLATEWVGMHFPYSNSPVRRFESSGISGSCFEPYFDWLDRGGYSLWIPEVVFTSTVTSSTTSSTSTTTTSMSFTSTTTSSSSTSTGTTTATDEDDLNDTNDTNGFRPELRPLHAKWAGDWLDQPVNASLFANGTLSMVWMGNREQGNYQDPMVADLAARQVNTGCGEGGCAFFEEEILQLVAVFLASPFATATSGSACARGHGPTWKLDIAGIMARLDSWNLQTLALRFQKPSGRNLPQGVETVVVPASVLSKLIVGDLKIHGKLSLAEEEGLKLLVKSIQVFAGGQFQVGTSWAPHKTTAIISFWGATFDSDPAYISLNLDWGKKVFGVYEVQQDVGDWPVGGEILLTTSEYPNLDGSADGQHPDTYTERRIITSIVFYAPSTVSRTILVTTEEALIGAEKFPDPELGVPNPGHGGEWFGFHMLAAGSSFVHLGCPKSMSWVQLDRGGFPALQFYHPENYFGIMGAIEVLGSWGMDSVNALFVGTRGSVIKAEMDVGPLFILQNLAVSTRRPPERVSLGLPYEPMSVFQLQAKPPVFAGNIVAGCEDIGFLLRPHTCEEVQQQAGDATVNMPNEVFGCVVGFFMLRSCSTAGAGPSSCPDSYDCVHLTHMRAWKNAHVGILFVDQPANMEVSDVQLFDNHIGITGTFHRKMGDMLHSFTMRDSKVYGSTALSNCNASLQCLAVGPGEASPSGCGSLPGPDVRRVGILLPIITNRGKTCEDGPVLRACPLANLPDRNCALPWESRYGTRGSRMSVFRLEDVDFGAFYAEDCGMRSVAIANNPSSRDWNPILEVRGLSWAHALAVLGCERTVMDLISCVILFRQLVIMGVVTAAAAVILDPAVMGAYSGGYELYAKVLDKCFNGLYRAASPATRRGNAKFYEESPYLHVNVEETARLKLGMEGSAPICPGVQQTWVRDLDGSLLRESGVALPTGGLLPSSCDSQTSSFLMATYIPSAWPQRCGNETTAQCPAGAHFAYTLEGGLTVLRLQHVCSASKVCQDRLRLLNWENLDPDCCGHLGSNEGFHRRELGLLRATRLSDGMYEAAGSEASVRAVAAGPCPPPLKQEAGLPLELRFMGTSQLPRLSRIHFFAESSGHEVLLRLPLGRLRRPRLYIFGINFDIMRRTSIPNAGDSHGAMYLDRERLWLYINARGMPGGSRGQGAIVLQLLEVFVAEVAPFKFVTVTCLSAFVIIKVAQVVFVPLEEFSQFKFVEDLARSLNVSEDRVSLVNITYDGQKWLEGPNGRRLRMDTLRIEFEVSEDPDILDLAALDSVLLDAPWESMGASDAFFEDSVAQALSVASIRNLSTTFQAEQGALNFGAGLGFPAFPSVLWEVDSVLQALQVTFAEELVDRHGERQSGSGSTSSKSEFSSEDSDSDDATRLFTKEQAEGWKDGDEARQTQKIAERPLHGCGFGFSLSELVR